MTAYTARCEFCHEPLDIRTDAVKRPKERGMKRLVGGVLVAVLVSGCATIQHPRTQARRRVLFSPPRGGGSGGGVDHRLT